MSLAFSPRAGKRRRIDPEPEAAIKEPATVKSTTAEPREQRCPSCGEATLGPSDDPSMTVVCTSCGFFQEQTAFERDRNDDRYNNGLSTVWSTQDPLQNLSVRLKSMARYRSSFRFANQDLSKDEARELRALTHIKRIKAIFRQVIVSSGPGVPLHLLDRAFLLFTSIRAQVIRAKDALREAKGESSHRGFLTTANVRWGQAADALASAALFATMHRAGHAKDLDEVAARFHADPKLARRQFALICRCLPKVHRPTDVLDPRLFLNRVFDLLDGVCTSKTPAQAKSVLLQIGKVNMQQAHKLALDLTEAMPFVTSSGSTSATTGSSFDPWSSAVAFVLLALEGVLGHH